MSEDFGLNKMEILNKIVTTVDKVQRKVGIIAFVIFLLSVLTQIVSRYMGISVLWTEEASTYFFIWMVFMGASVMVNKKQHFSFNLLSQKLKGRNLAILHFVVNLIVLSFTLILLGYGIYITKVFWNYNWMSIPSIKMGWMWISIPIMGGTMSLYLINHIAQDIKSLKKTGDIL